jgi:hypothetical protein
LAAPVMHVTAGWWRAVWPTYLVYGGGRMEGRREGGGVVVVVAICSTCNNH